jgi:prephenate dehydrogenase
MPSVLITSLGLMGGSLAAAASAAGWTVFVHHRRPEVAAEAERLGWGRAAAGFVPTDLAVVCTPVEHIAATVRSIAAASPAVITDVGSVKGALCRDLADLAGRFVGSHPMCGSHKQGLGNADPQLYRGRTVIVTPMPGNPDPAVALVERLWRDLGCRLVRLSAAEHDRAVAQASHLPHVLANLAARRLTPAAAPVCAGGFRDTTRVAGAGPELWTGILRANRDEVLSAARLAHADLGAFLAALESGDEAALAAWLAGGKAGRALYEAAQGA